nr:retrovirus-related Pol polyprotein from transposon TNT 1-94 [Tanacetum cinerariifolium]
MIVLTHMIFLSINSTDYLVSTGDGTMPLKELNSAKVRLLETRFYVLAIVTSLALTSGPSEVLLGVGFGLSAKGIVSPYDTVEEILLGYEELLKPMGNYTAGQLRVVKCYNCQGEGYTARQCTQPKRLRNSAWFKEKLMLVEAQEACHILDE